MVGAVLLAAIIAGVIWWCVGGKDTPADAPQVTDPTNTPVVEQPQNPTEETVAAGIQLEHGLTITHMGSYTGAYVEDGSNEIVSGVLMLRVTNNGQRDIQYAELSMPVGDAVAQFQLTTLPVGATMILLEQSRMAWDANVAYPEPVASNVAFFQYDLSLQEDLLQLQILDGAINITNISGQDIAGDVVIYYKNSQQDVYYGGITYRVRIQGGMKAGEIQQIMADHFSATGSEVVFITIG